MLYLGLFLVAVGVWLSVVKARVVREVGPCPFHGGGVPTLDFPVLCPLPVAAGGSWILDGCGVLPFDGFWVVGYVTLAPLYFLLMWRYTLIAEVTRKESRDDLLAQHQRIQDWLNGVTDRE